MKKLIFHFRNPFGSGNFFNHVILKNDQKLTGAKKVKILKNQLLHACAPRVKFFEFCSCCGFILMTDF